MKLTTLTPLLLSTALLSACSAYAPSHEEAAGARAHSYATADKRADVKADAPATARDASAEDYDRIVENEFLAAADAPLSTFSIDVDTASYSNVRRFLQDGALPPPDAVRVEELINYFDYDDPAPRGDAPFSVTAEVGACPWNAAHQLVRLGVRGKSLDAADVPPRNLVFLLDVSGSMNSPDKLPLLKRSMKLLASQLGPRDTVAIVVYAGASGVVLEPTRGDRRATIRAALDRLEAGGSTNGGEGIRLAYALAAQNLQPGTLSRVILATDGDFNVGTQSRGELERLIEEKRETGVYLSVLGLGTGNLKDGTMEALADHGNGNYAYIDSIYEARKVLVEEAGQTLATIAKDVKIQVEWNPAQVSSYRLIGYENRLLAARDFDDDRKDAGELGAGHTVVALYEVAPARGDAASASGELRYQAERPLTAASAGGELMHVKLRYKHPEGSTSQLLTFPVQAGAAPLDATSDDFRFSASVAAFGMLLRGSSHRGDASFAGARELAAGALADDRGGYRREFLQLIDRAASLHNTAAAMRQRV